MKRVYKGYVERNTKIRDIFPYWEDEDLEIRRNRIISSKEYAGNVLYEPIRKIEITVEIKEIK